MALLLRTVARQSAVLRHSAPLMKQGSVPMGTAAAYKGMAEFWAKNRQLERPLSPHLTIYKPEATSMLSLMHRVTGISMAVTISGVSIALLLLPGNFEHYLNMLSGLQLGPIIITGFKYLISYPVCYHYINGIRHLCWDWAWGFGMDRLYKTGALAVTLAILTSSTFVFFY